MKRYCRFLSRTMLAGLAAALLIVTAPAPADALITSTASTLTVDGGSTYNQLLAGSAVSKYLESIGNAGTGTYNHSGGTNTVGFLYLGNSSGSNGSYNLSGTGSFSTGYEYIGFRGTGAFTQTGGTHTVSSTLYLGLYASGNGSYNLSGTGALTTRNEIIGQIGIGTFTQTAGTGTFTQTGGTNTVTNNLTIAQHAAGGTGTYNLGGGVLTVENASHTSTGLNNGTFNYSGGALNVDTFYNNKNLNISGVGTRVINGNVTNNAAGTVKTTNTTARFTGTFTNNGAFISDPSSNYFTNLTIGATGYLTGGAGDNFYVSGDFSNSSTQNTLWNTTNAYLGFTGTGTHNIFMADWSQAADFGWGTMELADGGTLSLTGTGVGDLYVNNLILSTGSNLNLAGLNIHYNSITDNGGTYTGGLLIDSVGGTYTGGTGGGTAVPEPSTLLLLGSGLVGLGFVRRKFRV